MAKQTKHTRVIARLREANALAWGPTMKFFDYGEKQKSTPRETDIDQLRSALNVSRRDMAELVKGIVDAGIGTRIIGRRGFNSRMRWHFSLPSIAKVAREQADELEEVGGNRSSDDLVEYTFKLRDNRPPVTMKLFNDLTDREVERLYLFQKSLVK
jgi:hypothetical protein